ncbi:hypothetical protein [Flavobacterium sp.]|uniref:hypothetical protein n=1 Tax=Flavobacterium sp. TaxID=239 RepID=UPI002D125EA4|nr:hypothetical protein [Flavobacterium sp.]HSD08189.1 hypothetical protein [Flavobacterium sp.]
MKNFAIKLVWITTIYVIVFTALCQTELFLFLPVIMSMYFIGVSLVLLMVYTVLRDEAYKTSKKFKDWYGDYPKESFSK